MSVMRVHVCPCECVSVSGALVSACFLLLSGIIPAGLLEGFWHLVHVFSLLSFSAFEHLFIGVHRRNKG